MKGVYCLIINVKKNILLKIGSLGKIKFKKGNYIYVGSAMNGIENRIKRHLKNKKKKYWHIDYLTTNKNAKIKKVFYGEGKKDEECKIAKNLSMIGEGIKNFGSSDCKCKSHLFRIDAVKNLNKFNLKELKLKRSKEK